MAKLQAKFISFHEKIKLSDIEENATLRDKRDLLLRELKENLPEEAPKLLRSFNQGSYSMGTGLVPLDGDYDIDVGLVFENSDENLDPVVLKGYVKKALTRSNRTVNIRRPCVTVSYKNAGDVAYHVDLAVYSEKQNEGLYLAKGKEASLPEHRIWEISSPQELCNEIKDRHSASDGAQFRRIIRYLKRWRDRNFRHKGVLSIALTCAAFWWFEPQSDAMTGDYSDSLALRLLLERILEEWNTTVDDDGNVVQRLFVKLPVRSGGDLLQRMTQIQMDDFYNRLEALKTALDDATSEPDIVEACKLLVLQFGDDFPVPDVAEEKAKAVGRSVSSTGTSA